MTGLFPHNLLLALISARNSNDIAKAYDTICEAISSNERQLFAEFFQKPELQGLPHQMLEHYLALEEYEKCAEIRKFINEINQ